MKTPVATTGILRSATHGANCTVRAIKVDLPGSRGKFDHTDFSIEDVSRALPEGVYQLSAFGKIWSLRHENGRWLATV